MKKPQVKLTEKHCAACNGTGQLAMVSNPKKPTVRTYPPQCGVCLGKGRVVS
jgi:DnaJ-class molecular chaperone